MRQVCGYLDLHILHPEVHFELFHPEFMFESGAQLVNDKLLRDDNTEPPHSNATDRSGWTPVKTVGIEEAGDGDRLEDSCLAGCRGRGDHQIRLFSGAGEYIAKGDLLRLHRDIGTESHIFRGEGCSGRGECDHQGEQEGDIFHGCVFHSRKFFYRPSWLVTDIISSAAVMVFEHIS